MKKILTLIISALVTLGANAKITAPADSLKLYSHIVKAGDTRNLMTHGNNNAAYHMNWPEPVKGVEQQQAMVLLNWIGLPPEELNNITVTLDQGLPISVQSQTSGNVQTWIFVPLSTKSVILTHPRYGTATIYLKKMNQHDIWSMPVILDQMVNIQIRPLIDYDRSVRVTIKNDDGDERTAMTPATFSDVMPGNYNVRFVIDGHGYNRRINVNNTQTMFGGADFDFRNFKDVTFESSDRGATIFVDDIMIGSGNSVTHRLPYGSHKVVASVNANRKDEKTIDVNKDSESTIYLSPTETRTFEVVGLYDGQPVETKINVSGLSKDRYDAYSSLRSHSFTLPATGGKPYRFEVSYGSRKGHKDISITPGMATRQEIKINADRRMVWPWEREYEAANFGWEFSWVSKQYSTSGHLMDDSDIKTSVKENGVWDNGFDHWLHGFRTGFHAQPTLKFGLGFYTGLFFEFYFSGTDMGLGDGSYDKYFEADMSIPFHALYQFTLGKKLAIGFHTGPTFNWAMHGVYYDKFMPGEDDEDNLEDISDFWDEDWAPNRVNFTWDFGLYIRWKWMTISGTISRGMTDNKMHTEFGEDAKTVMNKRVLAFSIAF